MPSASRRVKLQKMSKTQLLDEVIALEVMLEEQLMQAPNTGNEIEVQGIVSHKTRQPVVQLRAGEAGWGFSPAQARQHAFIVLDAAVEAERDAATIAFCMEEMEMSMDAAGTFLHEMRKHRVDWFKEFREMGGVSVQERKGEAE